MCAAVGLFVTACFSAFTFALVVSLVEGLGMLSTTAVVLWFAGSWTLAWIGVEVGLVRWGDRLALSTATPASENGES